MKKYKIIKTKETIEALKLLWAQNWLAIEIENKKEKPDLKKIDGGKFNMTDCEKQIGWLEDIMKTLSAK